MDAVLVTRSVYSFVELSVSPVFRRQWSSIYEALEDGNPPRKELMKLYIKQLPQAEQIVLAGDHTAWSRLDARTLNGSSPATRRNFRLKPLPDGTFQH
jgi:hypothetical protein